MKRSVVVGLLLLAASRLCAAETWHTAQIRWIYPQADGNFVVTFQSDSAACTSANNPKYYFVGNGYNGVNAEGVTKIYAAAMLALALGKSLTIAFDEGTSSCSVNRALMGD